MTCCLDTGHPAVWLDTIYTSTLDTHLPALLCIWINWTNVQRSSYLIRTSCHLASPVLLMSGAHWQPSVQPWPVWCGGCRGRASTGAWHQPGPALPSRHRRSQDARKLRGGRHSAQHLAGDQPSSSSSSAAAQHAVLCQWWRPAAGAVVWPVARLVQVTPELSPVMY